MGRATAAWTTGLALVAAGMVGGAGRPAQALGGSDEVVVPVGGGPLASVEAAPVALVPAFAPPIHDYTLRCQPGVNSVSLRLGAGPGRRLQAGSQSGAEVSVAISLVESQAAVLQAADSRGASQLYWIRCLPHDFPTLAASRPGNPSPGWYLTGNTIVGPGAMPYAMILDTNGTPVWYEAAPGGALDVERVSATSVAWSAVLGPAGFGVAPNPGFGIRQLDGSGTKQIAAVGGPTDHHELLQLPDGGWLLLSYPLKTGVDLTPLGLGADQTIADCVIEQLDGSGNLVWQWRASDHIGVDESMEPAASSSGQGTVYDLFHLNSLDVDAGGDLLVSARNTDAVFLVRRDTGAIAWKLGGKPFSHDGARILSVVGDPEGTIYGQHDARFLPGGDVSLFDNHTWGADAARGVEYAIDAGAGTATFLWQYRTPSGSPSAAMGSFRAAGDGGGVVGWGVIGGSGFTEVDASGRVVLDVSLPGGDAAYRAVKEPIGAFDIDVLRHGAGSPRDGQAPAPLCPTVAGPPAVPGPVAFAPSSGPGPCGGYWLATAPGAVTTFGVAAFLGDDSSSDLDAPVTGMAATPDGLGYWLVASDGGVFAFGDAAFSGSMGALALTRPVVGMAATPDGRGYWLVASDGGVFAFGDAAFSGSMGAQSLNAPVVAIAPDPSGGYQLAASDGGVFSFGAPFWGSLGGGAIKGQVVAMASPAGRHGYYLVDGEGDVFAFGDTGVGVGAGP